MTKASVLYCLCRQAITHVALAFFMNFVAFALAPIALGFLVRNFFELLELGGAKIEEVLYWVSLMIVLALGRAAFFLGRTLFESTTRFVVGTRIRRNLFAGLLRFKGAQGLHLHPGDTISRFRDDIDEITWFVLQTIFHSNLVLFTMISLIVMARIDLRITLVVVLPIIILMAIVHHAKPMVQERTIRQRKAAARVSTFIGDIFNSIEAIQVANAASRIARQFVEVNRQRRQAALRDQSLNAILHALSGLTGTLAIGLTLMVAVDSMKSGAFSLGDFALFAHYIGYLSMGFSGVGAIISQYGKVGISLGRIRDVLPPGMSDEFLFRGGPPASLFRIESYHPSSQSPCVAPLEVLEIEDLSFRYLNSSRGIEGICLRANRGSLTVIAGTIGSGKTTLVRVLLGQLPKDKGRILWNGAEIEEYGSFFTPPVCAYCPQSPNLFSETLKDNILLGLSESEVDLPNAVERAVLKEDIEGLERGFDTVVGPRGARLSGGQVRRTAAARTFVREAELYVFDDPSCGLDVETEQLLWSRLVDRRMGRTYVVVSNRRAALLHADNIIVIKNGRVDGQGKLNDLLASCEEMKIIWLSS